MLIFPFRTLTYRHHIWHQFIRIHFKWFLHLMLNSSYGFFFCSSVVVIFVHSFFFCVNFAVVLYLVHFPPQMTLLHSEWETFYCLFYLKLCTLFRFNRIETVLPRERKKVCFSYWHSEEPIFQCAICTSKRCTTNGNPQRWHFTEKSAISFKVIENRHTHTHSHAYSNL